MLSPTLPAKAVLLGFRIILLNSAHSQCKNEIVMIDKNHFVSIGFDSADQC